jgi:hypothetical protein
VQWQFKILVGRVVLILTVYAIIKISLLVVKKAIHIEVIVFKGVLASALIKNLSGLWCAKQLNQVGRRDLDLAHGVILTVSFKHRSVSASPCIVLPLTVVHLFGDNFAMQFLTAKALQLLTSLKVNILELIRHLDGIWIITLPFGELLNPAVIRISILILLDVGKHFVEAQ